MEQSDKLSQLDTLLKTYLTPPEATELVRATTIVLLVGISGAGKDTIKQELLATGRYHDIISHTTRAPRENHGRMEKDGVDYHFIDYAAAEELLQNGGYIEAKRYGDNIYGTSVAEIQLAHDAGQIGITDLEVQGVAEYQAMSNDVTAVFILPPSYEIWQQRTKARHGQAADAADQAKRRDRAKIELQEALDKPYFHLVVNEDKQATARLIDGLAQHKISAPTKDPAAIKLAKDILRAIN